jgi:prevent-host-death family protein
VRVSVTAAEVQFAELIRLVEAGEEIILTRDGRPVVRLTSVPMQSTVGQEARGALLEAARRSGTAKAIPGPSAARSQDFLYDANGLPSET